MHQEFFGGCGDERKGGGRDMESFTYIVSGLCFSVKSFFDANLSGQLIDLELSRIINIQVVTYNETIRQRHVRFATGSYDARDVRTDRKFL